MDRRSLPVFIPRVDLDHSNMVTSKKANRGEKKIVQVHDILVLHSIFIYSKMACILTTLCIHYKHTGDTVVFHYAFNRSMA